MTSLFTLSLFLMLSIATGCTNLIISRTASTDSSTMITYNADSGSLYGMLYHYPKADHPEGTIRQVFDWDSGAPHGSIPEAPHTYNVVGNMNEFGLVIAETTFGGISLLQSQPDAKIDYGSLIWITLQRSKTAREAISVMDNLMQTYGYASGGESFSIADGNESFIMEIIGKGSFELGSVWVAQRVPEGHVTAHANQARTTTFPLNDPENCLYAKDTISFARKVGLFPKDETVSPDSAFDFSAAYDPISFGGARFCDARVWMLFGSLLGPDFLAQYQDYATGQNLTNRLPLFVKPPTKVSSTVAMSLMRSHYENSALDMSGNTFDDVGAAYASIPYRAHPLTWTSGGSNYVNERSISTPQTGWNFLAVTRGWMAPELRGILWFGVDDSATTVRLPVYSSSTRVSQSFYGKGPQDGVTPPMMVFDTSKAFYAFNLVANWAYSRWSVIYPDVLTAIQQQETTFHSAVSALDEQALKMIENGQAMSDVVEMVTKWSVEAGDKLVQDWNALFGRLFVKYRDGYLITASESNTACGCTAGSAAYPDTWYAKMAAVKGPSGAPQFLVPAADGLEGRATSVNKAELLSRR